MPYPIGQVLGDEIGWCYRGDAGSTDLGWIKIAGDRTTSIHRLYGMSGVFTVVPEPATMALLGLGGLGMLMGRRRHRV